MNYRELKAKIISSGIFDAKYYATMYPDVSILRSRVSHVDPLDHYIHIGCYLGRLPHQALSPEDLPPVPWGTSFKNLPIAKLIDHVDLSFDQAWYLAKYREIARAGIDPLTHYRKSGRYENRSPNAKADLLRDLNAAWYVGMYKAQMEEGITPLSHYLATGAQQGNIPNGNKQMASRFFHRFGVDEYRSKSDFHIEADTVTPLAEGFNLSIAVHMHVFYDSLLEEMSEYVSNIPVPYDVYISIPEGTNGTDQILVRARGCLRGCRNVIVRPFRNVGRDIAPMLAGFGPELLQYDLLLHIHSKRSLHSPEFSSWRRYLLHYTCGSTNITTQILNRFASQPSLGGCFPPYFGALRGQPSWGRNLENAEAICDRLGLTQVDPNTVPDFPAGSFFWIRSKAIAPLLENAFSFDDFDPELGQTDKTTAHAIERLFGHVPKADQPERARAASGPPAGHRQWAGL